MEKIIESARGLEVIPGCGVNQYKFYVLSLSLISLLTVRGVHGAVWFV